MEEREDLFRDLCENAHDLIQSVTPEGRFLYVNSSWLQTLGYSLEDLPRLNVFDIIHPDSHAHCQAVMGDLIAGKEIAYITADFLTRDGRRIPVEGSARCRFEGGRPVSTRGIFRDVSRRRELEGELKRFFDLSLDLLCVASTDGYFKEVNPAFERALGYTHEELTGRPFVEFVHPDDRAQTIEEVQRLATGHPVVDFENRYLSKDGGYRWLAWRAAPYLEKEVVYAVARDITDQKRIEERLVRQQADLERSNADLEQFAYIASHDLKAPLRAISNLAEWIEEDAPEALPEKAREYLSEMRRRVARMEALITDLLEYARAGRRESVLGHVATKEMVEDLVYLLKPPAGFRIQVDPSLPEITTARSPLEQVFRNLIANALKHHDRPEGTIRIGSRDAGEFFEFHVADDGPGIPEPYREKVFQMFERIRSQNEAAGTGMGLALVRKIVDLHGGRAWVEPADGRGATIRFTWPKAMSA